MGAYVEVREADLAGILGIYVDDRAWAADSQVVRPAVPYGGAARAAQGKGFKVKNTHLRAWIESGADGYKADEYGMIRASGKFEGERIYVPFYYGLALEGFADESGDLADGTAWDAFDVEEDAIECAEMFDGDTSDDDVILVIYYHDDGSIRTDLATRAEFEAWKTNEHCQAIGCAS